MFEEFKHAGVVLEIDPVTNIIVAVDATFVTELARRFYSRLITGYDVSNGMAPLERLIGTHVHTPSRESLIVATRAAVQRYFQIRDNRG